METKNSNVKEGETNVVNLTAKYWLVREKCVCVCVWGGCQPDQDPRRSHWWLLASESSSQWMKGAIISVRGQREIVAFKGIGSSTQPSPVTKAESRI